MRFIPLNTYQRYGDCGCCPHNKDKQTYWRKNLSWSWHAVVSRVTCHPSFKSHGIINALLIYVNPGTFKAGGLMIQQSRNLQPRRSSNTANSWEFQSHLPLDTSIWQSLPHFNATTVEMLMMLMPGASLQTPQEHFWAPHAPWTDRILQTSTPVTCEKKSITVKPLRTFQILRQVVSFKLREQVDVVLFHVISGTLSLSTATGLPFPGQTSTWRFHVPDSVGNKAKSVGDSWEEILPARKKRCLRILGTKASSAWKSWTSHPFCWPGCPCIPAPSQSNTV